MAMNLRITSTRTAKLDWGKIRYSQPRASFLFVKTSKRIRSQSGGNDSEAGYAESKSSTNPMIPSVPGGTDGIIGFVDDLLSAYPASLSFPPLCDLILFEVFTKRKEARGWL